MLQDCKDYGRSFKSSAAGFVGGLMRATPLMAILMSSSTLAQGPQVNSSVVAIQGSPERHEERRGYWWKKELSTVPDMTSDYPDLPSPPNEAQLLALHPKQVEKLIEDYRDYALWKMEPKHVVWYYQLQDFARRRSRAFMNVSSLIMLEHPDLNMQTVYPTNPPGQAARIAQREGDLNQRLTVERDNAALIVLVREGCQYCEAMRGVLKYFQERHGWTVKELDIERSPEAQRFATDYTPTTIMILRGSSNWMPVAVGVETLESLEENVYRAVRYLHGETTAQQFTLEPVQRWRVV